MSSSLSYLKLFRPIVSGANIWLFQTVSYCRCFDRTECDITKTKWHSTVTVLQSDILSQVMEWTILAVKSLRWNSKLLPSSLQTEKQKTFQWPLTKHVVGRTPTHHAGRGRKRRALQQTRLSIWLQALPVDPLGSFLPTLPPPTTVSPIKSYTSASSQSQTSRWLEW